MNRRMASIQKGQSWPKTPGQNSAWQGIPLLSRRPANSRFLLDQRVPLARRHDPLHVAEPRAPFRVHVGDVGRGGVEVGQLVPVPVEIPPDVVEAREADGLRDAPGIARRDVRGMVGAERGPAHGDVAAVRLSMKGASRRAGTGRRRRGGGRGARGGRGVVPALGIDRVDADDLDVAGVHLVGEGPTRPKSSFW